jgi:hypothetical protein
VNVLNLFRLPENKSGGAVGTRPTTIGWGSGEGSGVDEDTSAMVDSVLNEGGVGERGGEVVATVIKGCLLMKVEEEEAAGVGCRS